MTIKTKKPVVNKETYKKYVTEMAQQLSTFDAGAGSAIFNDAFTVRLDELKERVFDLSAVFRIAESVFDPKIKQVDLNLDVNAQQYRLADRGIDSQTYSHYKSYYARAFNEIVAITTAVTDAFQGMMDSPVSLDSAPCMVVHGKGGSLIGRLKRPGEAYHHARLEGLMHAYDHELRPLENSIYAEDRTPNVFKVHKVIADSLQVMSAARLVTRAYAQYRWTKLKN